MLPKIERPATSSALELNCRAGLQPIFEKGVVRAWNIRAPVPNEGLRQTVIDAVEYADLIATLKRLVASPGEGLRHIPATIVQRLVEVGLLLECSRLPKRVSYLCWLGEPSGSAPMATARDRLYPGELVVNPKLNVERTRAPQSGAGMDGCTITSPEPGQHIAGVASIIDPGTGIEFSYHLSSAQFDLLHAIRSGALRSADLTPAWRAHLIEASILLPPTELRRQRAAWTRRIATSRRQLGERGYTAVRHVLHPRLLGGLRDYYRALVEEGYLPFNDGQSQRFFAQNELIAVRLHSQLLQLVQQLIVEPIKDSYAYFACYVSGASLPRHVDREQCEYTFSLTLDISPDLGRRAAWPLYVELATGCAVAFRLAPGDGLLFKGRVLPHFRHALPVGHRSMSVFLHFVPADFSGPLA
jgi:hypothetical protein